MRRSTVFMLGFGMILGTAVGAAAATPDGKVVFLAQKCDMCHAVSSAGIEATTKSEKMKGPDLAGACQALDPVWLADFIQKKVDKNGKKHAKEFKGTDEDLAALIAWLNAQTKT